MTDPRDVRNEWARLNRIYAKAHRALAGAEAYICRTTEEDGPWAMEDAGNKAIALLTAAANELNRELDVNRKRLNIGIYSPYGSLKGRR